jgi:hypothetical protein
MKKKAKKKSVSFNKSIYYINTKFPMLCYIISKFNEFDPSRKPSGYNTLKHYMSD